MNIINNLFADLIESTLEDEAYKVSKAMDVIKDGIADEEAHLDLAMQTLKTLREAWNNMRSGDFVISMREIRLIQRDIDYVNVSINDFHKSIANMNKFLNDKEKEHQKILDRIAEIKQEKKDLAQGRNILQWKKKK